jgi:serine/threonine-protein phosphatase 2B regulatory subunit
VTEESKSSLAVTPKERGSHTLSRFSVTRNAGSMNNGDRHDCISTGSCTPPGSCTPRAGVQRTKSRLKRVQSEKIYSEEGPKDKQRANHNAYGGVSAAQHDRITHET